MKYSENSGMLWYKLENELYRNVWFLNLVLLKFVISVGLEYEYVYSGKTRICCGKHYKAILEKLDIYLINRYNSVGCSLLCVAHVYYICTMLTADCLENVYSSKYTGNNALYHVYTKRDVDNSI